MKRFNMIIAVAGALSLAACQSDKLFDDNSTNTDSSTKPPVVEALKGEMLVKLKPEVIGIIERQGKSMRSAGRSGVSPIDQALNIINAYSFERVFPIDSRNEDRTRTSGMHCWYVVRFDESTPVEAAYEQLSKLSDVTTLQYSHVIQRGYQPRKATVLSESAMKRISESRQYNTAAFNDPQLPQQWGYINYGDQSIVTPSVAGVDVGCSEAWKKCGGDNSIIVAVLDEGVMYDHEDLKENMWVNQGEALYGKEDVDGNGYVGDVHGYNFVFDTGVITYNDANDTGHGTHVAGSIAAVNNNGIGVAGVAGGTGNGDGVKIMSCQIFSGNYGVSLYNEARAIKYAADNGAVILQCSWGYNSALANPLEYYPGPSTEYEWASAYPLEKDALDYFINNAGSPNGVIEGGLAIFASGNESAGQSAFPAAYSKCISVASVSADGTPSNFTNFGHEVSISAPGGDSDYHKGDKGKILSTVPVNGLSGYGFMEGTSMACPHASGVAALGLSYAKQQRRHFKATEFREIMEQSCTPVEGYFTDTKYFWLRYEYYGEVNLASITPNTYKNKMGHGLVNAAKLFNIIDQGAGHNMVVPNMYVELDGTSKIDFARFFIDGQNMTYACSVDNSSVATVAVSGTIATFSGLSTGSVKATVTTSNGTSQSFVITVRKNAGSNGWL